MLGFHASHRALLGGAVLLAPLVVIAACSSGGGGGGDDGSAAAFTGEWQGTWQTSSPGPSGTLTLQLDDFGGSVTGQGTFGEHPCFAICNVACKANDEGFSGWLEAGEVRMTFHAECSSSGRRGHSGRHGHCWGRHEGPLTGTYEIQDGPCMGESGTIRLTRVPAAGAGAPDPGGVWVGDVFLIGPEGEITRLPVIELSGRVDAR